MFCPICRSFIDSSKNHCSACGTIVDLDSITKSKKQNKSTNSSSKRKSKKQNKRVKVKITKPKTKKAAKKNNQKKKSNSKRKSKRKKTKKAQKPSAKRAMLEDLRNYFSKKPNKMKHKKSKKRNKQKTKSSNPNGKSKRKRGKKIRQTKTNTTIKSKTGRIEYNNGYAVVEGASWNGKRMKKGSFKKRFNGENHGFQVSTWALGGVGKNYKNKWVK